MNIIANLSPSLHSQTKWDSRFIRIAREVATWSKDPRTQVGAVLVRDRTILATGFNGFPRSLSDESALYLNREYKLAHVIHAETNALLSALRNGTDIRNSTLYVTFAPCQNCGLQILQSGVVRVVHPSIPDTCWADQQRRTLGMFRQAGISTFELHKEVENDDV